MKKLLIRLFLWYLRSAARIQLWKIKPKIIAITGSMGKTSLRNAILAVLKDNFKVKKSIKANSETGIPLDILDLHPTDYSLFNWLKLALLIPWQLLTNWREYDYYICELGVDDPYPPKNMEYLLSFIHPDIAIFLNVSAVHTQQFEKIIPKNKTFSSPKERENYLTKAIAAEKGKIITFLPADKIAIVNTDDPLVMEETKQCMAKLLAFGQNPNYQLPITNYLQITSYHLSLNGTEFTYQYQNKEFKAKIPYLLPEYYTYTLAAAILIGIETYSKHNIPNYQLLITNYLQHNFQLPPGRMSVFKGIKDTILIDSSYNASKIPTLGALELLKNPKTNRKKIFVFGDMRELGDQAKSEHEEVAREIINSRHPGGSEATDRIPNNKKGDFIAPPTAGFQNDNKLSLVLIGPLTKQFVLPLTKNRLPTHWFLTSYQAADWLKTNLKGNEIILVKGSQNTIFTEIVVEELLADKKDVSRLCRRGKFWNKWRKKIQ